MTTQEEKDAMANFSAILERGFTDASPTPSIPVSQNPVDFYGGVQAPVEENYDPIGNTMMKNHIAPPAFSATTGAAQADPMMKDFNAIVNGFVGSAQTAIQHLVESKDPEIKEALQTKVVSDGIKIGKWKIVVRLVESSSNPDKQKKHFNIIHSSTGDTIAEDLWLYEAAHGLVRHLNNGKPINSTEIKTILNLEEKFAARKLDAISYARKFSNATKQGNYKEASIFEDRFDYAKSQALDAKEKIKKLSKTAL